MHELSSLNSLKTMDSIRIRKSSTDSHRESKTFIKRKRNCFMIFNKIKSKQTPFNKISNTSPKMKLPNNTPHNNS